MSEQPAQDPKIESPKIETAKEKENDKKREKELKKYAPKYGAVSKVTVTRSYNLGNYRQDVSIEYYLNLDDDADVILSRIQPIMDGLAPIIPTPQVQPQEQRPAQAQPPQQRTEAQEEQERIKAGIDPEAPATEKQYKAMFAIWNRLGKPPELKPVSKMTRLEASNYIEKYGNTSKVTPASELPQGVRRQYF